MIVISLSVIFIINVKNASRTVLVFPLFTLNISLLNLDLGLSQIWF